MDRIFSLLVSVCVVQRVWVRGVPPLISASSGPSAFVIRVDLSADVYRLQLVYEDPSRPLPHLEYSAGAWSPRRC